VDGNLKSKLFCCGLIWSPVFLSSLTAILANLFNILAFKYIENQHKVEISRNYEILGGNIVYKGNMEISFRTMYSVSVLFLIAFGSFLSFMVFNINLIVSGHKLPVYLHAFIYYKLLL
jgi:hypothetical protein